MPAPNHAQVVFLEQGDEAIWPREYKLEEKQLGRGKGVEIKRIPIERPPEPDAATHLTVGCKLDGYSDELDATVSCLLLDMPGVLVDDDWGDWKLHERMVKQSLANVLTVFDINKLIGMLNEPEQDAVVDAATAASLAAAAKAARTNTDTPPPDAETDQSDFPTSRDPSSSASKNPP